MKANGKTFTVSSFLRRSGQVIAATDEFDVLLTRRDGDDLVLSTASRAEAGRDALLTFARLVAEMVARPDGAPHLAGHLPRAFSGAHYLTGAERVRLLAELAEAAHAAADLGAAAPLARALQRWRSVARARAKERIASAHLTRPVAIPEDIDDPTIAKASGLVELPLHVRWSYPRRSYDLDDPRQRRLVYEQVLSEGLEDDVRRYIDVDMLVADWGDLVLPPRVRRTWSAWLRRRRGLTLAC